MKAILIPFLSLLIPLTPQSAFAQSEPELKLESVVIVSRHGVRAPTKATQLMQDVTPDAWPTAGKTGLADTARWRANRLSRTLPTPASGSRRIAGEKGLPAVWSGRDYC